MLIPYEHKRGRSGRSADNQPEAWASDRLQVIAYAAMDAEHSGQEISEGRIRYHADNVMVRVPIDEAAFDDLKKAVARARVLQGSVERPPVTDNERLCVKCSLAPVCLPEEARLSLMLSELPSARRKSDSLSSSLPMMIGAHCMCSLTARVSDVKAIGWKCQ